jgi:DNA-binding transcriptional MerR regulator
LRYWEQEFPQLNPSKRRGNRRYYQRKDVLLIRRIRNLLYDQGFTIEGARAQLLLDNKLEESEDSEKAVTKIENLVQELENILSVLQYNGPHSVEGI